MTLDPSDLDVGERPQSRPPPRGAPLRADARGLDGGIRQGLAARVVLRSGGRSAFGGKPEKHTLVLSLTGSYPSGHSAAFTRLAYRPWSQTARWKRGIIPPLHE